MVQKQNNVDQDAEKIEQEMYNNSKRDAYMNDDTAMDQIKRVANKQIVKKGVGRVVTAGARLASLKIIIAVVASVAIIIFLVGIISFFLTMPDMVRGRLIELADELWTDIKGIAVG